MHDEILSYADKYEGNSKSKGMASLGRKIPADISEELSEKIRERFTFGRLRELSILSLLTGLRISHLKDKETVITSHLL